MVGLNNPDILLKIKWAIQNTIDVFDRSPDGFTNKLQRQNYQ